MLVDTFMFYNELDVLELRLTVLGPHVDLFVIVEAEVNHVGGPKELFFQNNKERFGEWLPKIRHIVVNKDECPTDENPWSREKYQRECILRGLEGVPDDACIMVSDLDEIPWMEKIPRSPLPHVICSVHMYMFEYSMKYIFTGEPWIGTVLTNCGLFKRVGPNYFRENRWKFPVFQYSGWHLSSFGNSAHVYNKLQTYAHGKDPERESETPELFDKYINDGIHLDGKTALVPRPNDVPLQASLDTLQRLNMV